MYADGCAVTGSLYAIASSFSPVTFAESTVGAWPSMTSRWNGAAVPAALPDPSKICARFMGRVAMAFAAASAPPNERTCEDVPLPDATVTARVPPGDSTTSEYACAPAETGSV